MIPIEVVIGSKLDLWAQKNDLLTVLVTECFPCLTIAVEKPQASSQKSFDSSVEFSVDDLRVLVPVINVDPHLPLYISTEI